MAPRLAVDLGTSHTVAVVRREGQPPRALLFDGSPLLPSGVFAAPDGTLHVGRDAVRLAQFDPTRFEPHPKRRIDDGTVLLGTSEVPVTALLAAVLHRVAQASREAGAHDTGGVVLTCPVEWGRARRALILDAANRAGLRPATIVDEPIAAATYCFEVVGRQVPVGKALAVFDFGGGTLDLAVLVREQSGLRLCATGGLCDLGGLDVDAAIVDHLGAMLAAGDPGRPQRLAAPTTPADLHERRLLWDEVRAAKEMLSRATVAPLRLPNAAVHLTRDELERLAAPLVDRAVEATARVLAGLERVEVTEIMLVGGSSRIPLVASRLHTRLGIAPTVPEQPELPVAYGGLLAAEPAPMPAGQTLPAVGSARPGGGLMPAAGMPAGSAWPSGPPVRPVGGDVGAGVPGPARSRARRWGVVASVVALTLTAALVAWLIADRNTTDGRTGDASGSGAGKSLAAAAGSRGAKSTATAPEGFASCASGVPESFCPKRPTCWGGMVISGGDPPTAKSLDCSAPHYWETFAGGVMPADAAVLDSDQMLEHSVLKKACSEAILAVRSTDANVTRGWERLVLPKRLASGQTVFHCVAAPAEGGERSTSVFRSA